MVNFECDNVSSELNTLLRSGSQENVCAWVCVLGDGIKNHPCLMTKQGEKGAVKRFNK